MDYERESFTEPDMLKRCSSRSPRWTEQCILRLGLVSWQMHGSPFFSASLPRQTQDE